MTADRFALIDLGSNSIRLVLFDRARPFAAPLINEKAVVELGRGLDETGAMEPEWIAAALNAFARFKWLLDGLKISEVHIIATAAARDASNSADLIKPIEALMGVPIQILEGEAEAHFSAKGVLLAIPGAKGLVADLGGGSLELARIGPKGAGKRVSLPLGVLRLEAKGLEEARLALKSAFAELEWLNDLGPKDRLYLVGGTWRALARAHMAHKGYALNVLHRYAISPKALGAYAKKILKSPRHRLDALDHVPANRRAKLPWAALAAETLASKAPFKRAIFSEAGLREGFSAELLGRENELSLSQSERYDEAIAALIPDGGRFGAPGNDLFTWMAPLFGEEKPSLRDRRRQACQLYDFGWEAHPSYRNVDIPSSVLHTATLTQTHRDRAYLGLVLLLRHGGDPNNGKANPWLDLVGQLPKSHRRHAVTTGWALRLAHKISRGIGPLIRATSLHMEDLRLTLRIHEPDLADMPELFMPTLRKLATSLAVEAQVEIITP